MRGASGSPCRRLLTSFVWPGPTEEGSRIRRNRRPSPTRRPRGLMRPWLFDHAVDESPHRRYLFPSLCTCEAIGSWPSFLRCWRCAPSTSSSQGARHIPLKRTVFRHAKLSKIFRESFDLAGKLLPTVRSLVGHLDPKVNRSCEESRAPLDAPSHDRWLT